ncbi:MAG: hypothetical protein ACREUA_00845 [Burkholderiales bacterium]
MKKQTRRPDNRHIEYLRARLSSWEQHVATVFREHGLDSTRALHPGVALPGFHDTLPAGDSSLTPARLKRIARRVFCDPGAAEDLRLAASIALLLPRLHTELGREHPPWSFAGTISRLASLLPDPAAKQALSAQQVPAVPRGRSSGPLKRSVFHICERLKTATFNKVLQVLENHAGADAGDEFSARGFEYTAGRVAVTADLPIAVEHVDHQAQIVFYRLTDAPGTRRRVSFKRIRNLLAEWHGTRQARALPLN